MCKIQLRIQLLPIHQRTNPKSKSQYKEFNKRVDELHRNEDVSILSQQKNTSNSIWLRCILFAFFNEQNKIYRRHHRLIII